MTPSAATKPRLPRCHDYRLCCVCSTRRAGAPDALEAVGVECAQHRVVVRGHHAGAASTIPEDLDAVGDAVVARRHTHTAWQAGQGKHLHTGERLQRLQISCTEDICINSFVSMSMHRCSLRFRPSPRANSMLQKLPRSQSGAGTEGSGCQQRRRIASGRQPKNRGGVMMQHCEVGCMMFTLTWTGGAGTAGS